MLLPPPTSTLFPYTTLFRSLRRRAGGHGGDHSPSRGAGRGELLQVRRASRSGDRPCRGKGCDRSEEHTSELQSQFHLVCRLLLEKKKNIKKTFDIKTINKLV